MRFEAGRTKTGGREKGTPNKVTAQWQEWVDTAVSLAGQVVESSVRADFERVGLTLPRDTPAPVVYLLRQALDDPATFTRSILAKRIPAAIAGATEEAPFRIEVVTGTDPGLGEPGEERGVASHS